MAVQVTTHLDVRGRARDALAFYAAVFGGERVMWGGFRIMAHDATVLQELGPAPWSPLHGKLTDRFGTTWTMDLMTDGGAPEPVEA